MEEVVNIVGASKYVYSDKIKNRRRSLFPCENSEMVDKFLDNSDIDQITPLSTSDSECESYGVSNNISLIASTNLVSDILSTPNSKNYSPSEQSMSPLYLSPYGNMVVAKSVLTELSPTKYLKTPNYSNIHCGIPKLSRKCSLENAVDKSDSKKSDKLPNPPKTSKVRTTLFPELDTMSLAPKQFYPKIDFHKPVSEQKVSKQAGMKVQKANKKKNSSKRLFGQINIGVRHNIKKPKKRKIVLETKITQAQLAKIKTYKKDELVNSELTEYLKDLSELNESKKVRLIQYSSRQDTIASKEDTSSSLKRTNDSIDDTICKKQKLIPAECNSASLYENSHESEVTEYNNEALELPCTKKIDEILCLLDNSISQDKENKSHDKENDSNIVENCFSETLLSPTSEMCNMASVMNIDSPKKAKNLNLLFQNMTDNNAENSTTRRNNEKPNQSEYFPIFYPASKLTNKSDSGITKHEFSVKRKKMKISSNQMLLDAGQKRFGLVECSQCKYVYNAGDPNDETMHNNHHNATSVLQFSGWKNEHLVETFSNGCRIIQVMPTDSKLWIDKVERVIEVINRDMGYYDMTFDIGASKVFLFISGKNIIGCLVAERKTRGFKILNSQEEIDLCSTEEFAIECGVSRIWVAPQFRKKRVATKLMDALKSHFILGRLLKNCDIALSSPTTDGKLFAAKYFQTKNFFTYFD